MTSTPTPDFDPEEDERLALERAVAEARASGPGIPHEVMRAEMRKMVAEARRRLPRAGRPDGETHGVIGYRTPMIPHGDTIPERDLVEAERRALEQAIAEARGGGPDIPHEVVEAEMEADLARLRMKIAELTAAK